MADRETKIQEAVDAWVDRQMENCPPLGPRQRELIRSAFAEDRVRKAAAA